MSGRVPSSDGPWPGTGTDQLHVPLGQTACFLLSFAEGRGGMLFANVCAWFISFCYGEYCKWCFGGFLVSSWCLVHVVNSGFSGLPVVHKIWVTQVCLLLDTPFGRRSVEALPL